MSKKKTTEEFKKEVYDLVGNEYTVLSEYIDNKTKIQIRHNKCNFEYGVQPNAFLNGRRCPKCAKCIKKDTEYFKKEMFDLVENEYVILSEYKNSNIYIKLKHNKCGYQWEVTPNNFLNGDRCPVCANKKVLVGYNDMWTTAPELAKLLANPDDGYKYTQCSDKRLDWKCSECGNIIKNRMISSIKNQGLSCPRCSDGIPYPEKFMYNLLNQLNVDFEYQKKFDWCKYELDGKQKYGIYDFYIPSNQIIIETDGGIGHGKSDTKNLTKNESIKVDNIKDKLAQDHGVEVVRIDCNYRGKNRFEYIKDSIKNNIRFSLLFNLSNINWIEINSKSQNSLVMMACNLWNLKQFTVPDICLQLNLSETTIRRYLSIGTYLNYCYYDPKDATNLALSKTINTISKPVMVLKNNNIVGKFNSASELSKQSLNIFNTYFDSSYISKVCKGKKTNYKGYTIEYIKERKVI